MLALGGQVRFRYRHETYSPLRLTILGRDAVESIVPERGDARSARRATDWFMSAER